MAIEKMRYVIISAPKENVLDMIQCMDRQTMFHPELASTIIQQDDGGTPYDQELIYTNYLNRMHRIEELLNRKIDKHEPKKHTLDAIEEIITKAENVAQKNAAVSMKLETFDRDDQLAYQKFLEYQIEPQDDLGFIGYGFGKMTLTNYNRLFDFNHEQVIFTLLHQNRSEAWVLYVCLKSKHQHIKQIFDSLGFEQVSIDLDFDQYDFNEELGPLVSYLETMSNYEKDYQYTAIYSDRVTMAGYIPASHLQKVKASLHDCITIKDFDPDIRDDIMTPTLLRNNGFTRKFEMFVDMYGLPKYGEFDPTSFFAITYSILFGAMFGDLGQGLVIALFGWYMAKKSNFGLGYIMMRLGVSSMIFGFIYGSLFGNEEIIGEILAPLNIGLPIHVTSPDFTMNLLISAVGLGAVLILGSILINIITSLKHKRYERALFTQNGLAGLIFYAFILLTFVVGTSILNPITIITFIVIPLLVMFLKEPLTHLLEKKPMKPSGGWGEYILESFFEMFEVLIGFVSNTMSFMRVGGFVLSHAGMMTVVAVLQDMSKGAGVLVFVFGNLFVIALEGLLVGIQTLRLNYYELFSRFYDGGGKPFKAIR